MTGEASRRRPWPIQNRWGLWACENGVWGGEETSASAGSRAEGPSSASTSPSEKRRRVYPDPPNDQDSRRRRPCDRAPGTEADPGGYPRPGRDGGGGQRRGGPAEGPNRAV